MVEQDFVNEKKSAVREFDEQKIYLRDHLITTWNWPAIHSSWNRSRRENWDAEPMSRQVHNFWLTTLVNL